MVDFSKSLIGWILQQKYAILDVNVYPKPFMTSTMKNKDANDDYSGDLMVYLWDNYIQLTEARKIVLVGHGPGCQALMYLLNHRSSSAMRWVKGIIQVVGHPNVPSTPRDHPELRKWYYSRSAVFLPDGHRLLATVSPLKKHGRIHKAEEQKPIKLMIKSFDRIKTYIPKMFDDTYTLPSDAS